MIRNIFSHLIIGLFFIGCFNIDLSDWDKKFRRKREVKYYDNGCKKHSISYFNNKFDGPMIRWNENCDIISEANYENGMLHGSWIEYYPNGQIMHSINYFYNQKNGFDRWYYSNGYLKSEAIYEYDKIVSETLYWDKDGNMLN